MIALHLLRHAHAGDPAKWGGDDDVRPLSARGRDQSAMAAHVLLRSDGTPDVLVTSPRVRAHQTAAIVAEALGCRVVVDDRLTGPLDASVVEAILGNLGPVRSPCLVGHDPDFSSLLGELVGVDAIPMRKGAVARVDLERPVAAGRGLLRYLVPPELLAGG